MKRSFILGAAHGAGVLGVILLGVLIAYAADILTVDKDGTVRLRVSDTGKVTLNTSEATEGDLRFTPRTADPTAPVEGDLWYNATDSTLKAREGNTTIPVPGRFQRYTTSKTDGDWSSSSTTFVAVTGLSTNFTTEYANQVVHISFLGTGFNNTTQSPFYVDLDLDGASISNYAYGIIGITSAYAGHPGNLSFSMMYVVPSAGNHTMTVKARTLVGTTTITLSANSGRSAKLELLKFY